MHKWARLGAIALDCAFYRVLLLLFAIPVCHAILVNQTIDSNKGDPVTGFVPIYQPQASSPWADQTCGGCYIQPDPSLAFDGTWMAATYHPQLQNVNLTLRFTGVAVWVFFILSNANSHGPGTTTNTQVNITLDGNAAGSFSHNPDLTTEAMIYNAPVFSTTGLSNSPHELVIATNDYPISTFINFDWAIYTVEVDSPTTPPSQGTSPSSSSTATTSTGTSVSTGIHSASSSSTSTNSTSSSTQSAHGADSPNASSSSAGAGFASSTNLSSTVNTSSPTPIAQNLSSKIGAIVGSSLGGLALIALILLFIVHRWRRKPSIQYEKAGGMFPPPQPYDQPDSSVLAPSHEFTQSKAARLRQMELEEQIRSLQREMDGLNSNQGTMSVASPSTAGSSRTTRPVSELASLRNEIRQLRAQIGTLQVQPEFDDDELLPPAYTRH